MIQTCSSNGQKTPLWSSASSLGSSNNLRIHNNHLQWWLETEVLIFSSLNRLSQLSVSRHSGLGERRVPAEVRGWCSYLTEEVSITDCICFPLNHLQGVRPQRNCFICLCFHFSICNHKIMEPYLFPTHVSDTCVQINWGWIIMWQQRLMRLRVGINKDESWMPEF